MKNENIVGFYLLVVTVVMALYLAGCQKEHAKYRFTPKYHVGELVQFEKSIEHDWVNQATGERMWDIPQPMVIDSFYYNQEWRDNWYFVKLPDGSKYGSSIDELSLQKWTGKLQK